MPNSHCIRRSHGGLCIEQNVFTALLHVQILRKTNSMNDGIIINVQKKKLNE